MKKSSGLLKRSLSEMDASSGGVFESMYNVDVAIREFEKIQARGPLFEKELNELKELEMQMNLLKPETPEYAELHRRFKEVSEIICGDSSPEPAGIGKTVTEALLKLKYGLLHMTYMIVLRLLIVVVNVAALVGLIYFLPTFVDWLF